MGRPPSPERPLLGELARKGHSPGFIAAATGYDENYVRVAICRYGYAYKGMRARGGKHPRPAIPRDRVTDYKALMYGKGAVAGEIAAMLGIDVTIT